MWDVIALEAAAESRIWGDALLIDVLPLGDDFDRRDEIVRQVVQRARLQPAAALADTALVVPQRDESRIRQGVGKLADDGAVKPTKLEAVNRGWVSVTRPWHLVSRNTGLGDPRAATAEKGRALMQILTERIGRFLVELAAAPRDATFPY